MIKKDYFFVHPNASCPQLYYGEGPQEEEFLMAPTLKANSSHNMDHSFFLTNRVAMQGRDKIYFSLRNTYFKEQHMEADPVNF